MTRAKYRRALPQMTDKLFLTDGGIETTLMFHEGFDLPHFAAFDLLKDPKGRAAIEAYYTRYAAIARERQTGFILESATWRASSDWATLLGYSKDELARINADAITLLFDLRNRYETATTPCVVSGCVGPRSDGYNPTIIMSAEEAQAYHQDAVTAYESAGADMVTAITMTYAEEAIGVTRAAQALGMPVVISFTVETDGRLPSGQMLGDAIRTVDAATGNGPAYFMLNCAHPNHFVTTLADDDEWLKRIHGIRANASTMSHEELDNAEELDEGDPQALAKQYRFLRRAVPNLNVIGGCCGTDHRHIEAAAEACLAA